MTITDETLMAFLDDELTIADREEITGQLKSSPGLASRVANMRRADKLLVQSCHRIDSKPMPREIMAMLEAFPSHHVTSTRPATATILPLRKLHQRITHAPLWQMAVAATVALVIGLGAGRQLLTSQGSTSTAQNTPNTIVAQLDVNVIKPDNALFSVLEKQPSATSVIISASNNTVVTPIMTFRTINNGYCREYNVTTKQSGTQNVACRIKDAWIVKASTPTGHKISTTESQYQTASGPDNPALNAIISGLIKGDALGVEQEASIIQDNWQRK